MAKYLVSYPTFLVLNHNLQTLNLCGSYESLKGSFL